MTWAEAAGRWYLVLIGATWAFAPLIRWLFAASADRGATAARPVALLFALYPAWLLTSIGVVRFDERILVAVTVVGGLASWAIAFWRREVSSDWLRTLILVETASFGCFALYIGLHGYTPEIMGTEKPMDVAFLASSARAISMPPPDPWFAGEPINYYYLGYLLNGSIARLAGVPPQIGFNLALATIFSATVVTAFGLGWNGVRSAAGPRLAAVSGLLAAFAVAFAGNLYAPWRLLQDARATIDAFWWDSAVGIGWRSSRIVCDGPRVGNLCRPPATETINEFPFFSFLLGDLHPHLMALPFTLVALAMAWNLASYATTSAANDRLSWYTRVALSGALVGGLLPLNSWDVPAFMAITAVAILAACQASPRWAIASLAVLGFSALLAWAPFLANFTPPTVLRFDVPGSLPPFISRVMSILGVHTGERTSVVEYLTIFGVPYSIAVILVASRWVGRMSDDRDGMLRTLAIATVATVIPGALLAAPVIPLCGIPLAMAIDLLWDDRTISPGNFSLVLLSAAWILSIGVEVFYIRDAFDDRMNTLFKIYYQTWTLYAVAAAVTTAVLWTAWRSRHWARLALASGVTAAVIASAAYPVIASYQWTDKFESWQGLDGLAYGEMSSPDDVAAIRWLQQQASAGDVVLEAAGCAYLPFDRLPFNRVAAFTGVPTIIGWGDNHQRQWRAGQPDLIAEIASRQKDVVQMYANPGSPLFDRYGVDWLFVGDYEAGNWRSECATAGPYPGVNEPGFPGPGWEEAFRSGDTRIYRRVDA